MAIGIDDDDFNFDGDDTIENEVLDEEYEESNKKPSQQQSKQQSKQYKESKEKESPEGDDKNIFISLGKLEINNYLLTFTVNKKSRSIRVQVYNSKQYTEDGNALKIKNFKEHETFVTLPVDFCSQVYWCFNNSVGPMTKEKPFDIVGKDMIYGDYKPQDLRAVIKNYQIGLIIGKVNFGKLNFQQSAALANYCKIGSEIIFLL